LRKLLRYVMSDEARHVAFGVLTLSEFYSSLGVGRVARAAGVPARQHAAGPVPGHDARGVGADGRRRGGGGALHDGGGGQAGINPAGGFARGFFAKLVPNVRKLGLLEANDGYLRQKWGEAGLLEFEFSDDTGSDYETYDAVAEDRAMGPGRRTGRLRRRADRPGVPPIPMARTPVKTSSRIRAICLGLPETEEKPFGGHTSPAFRVRDKMFVVISEDRTSMTVKAPPGVQAILIARIPSGSSSPSTSGARAGSGSGSIRAPRPTGKRWPRSSTRATP
jgi:hypothetical protein